ncbi:hypothetical protein LQ564_24205 [Massilia sp. G4R7]|uniref:Glycosyl transferase family 2 n=1 Tax=Massilia phyllostachyos TaxID=2898585 RepID=A0ABS8QCC7_9BURK|nr:hypothetical protein [Massilia phyllostachyos]MCD2519411.1 hypothetical protein [Massilia phyllostachyos]
MSDTTNWAVAIIASRESVDTLISTVLASLAATPETTLTDVLVNGNAILAKDMAAWAAGTGTAGRDIRIWSISQGDKAHAWNEYVHRIWPAGRTAFFLDGYARPRTDGLRRLADSLARQPDAFGATGVPSSGRSAPALRAAMLKTGGFHGNMHAIPVHAMDGLRATGFRLPLGLYRTDSMIGAVLMFALDPTTQQWQPGRVAVNGDATWDVPGQSALTVQNILSQFKRRMRQAQGDLENRAARDHFAVRCLPINQIASTSRELVLNWIAAHPEEARRLYRANPLCWRAAFKMRQHRDWSAAERPPALLRDTGATRVRA